MKKLLFVSLLSFFATLCFAQNNTNVYECQVIKISDAQHFNQIKNMLSLDTNLQIIEFYENGYFKFNLLNNNNVDYLVKKIANLNSEVERRSIKLNGLQIGGDSRLKAVKNQQTKSLPQGAPEKTTRMSGAEYN